MIQVTQLSGILATLRGRIPVRVRVSSGRRADPLVRTLPALESGSAPEPVAIPLPLPWERR